MDGSKTIVYFIEGLPGVGKTTTAEWLSKKLDADFITEESSNYPNDLFHIATIKWLTCEDKK